MHFAMMCGSCMKRHGRITPSNADQGPHIIEVRKGRWIRIQHVIPHTWRLHVAEVQDDESIFFVNTTHLTNHPRLPSAAADTHHDSHINMNASCNHNSTSYHSSNPQSSTTSLKTTSSKASTIKTKPSTISQRHTSRSRTSLHSAFDDGNVVVFLIHGVGGSSDVWRHQIDYFVKEGFEVVAPDLLGHGFSQAPRKSSAYAFHEIAEDMLALFDGYCKRRNILIGHSYGSSFCTKIARERARKVTKMILISGGGPIPLEPQSCQVFGLPACLLCCIKPVIADLFARRAFHSQRVKSRSEKLRAFDVPSYVLRGMMQGQDWMEGDEDYHLAIAVSVLLIYGMQDKFVSLEEEEWMQETIYASQLATIECAGHMAMVECPERVNQLLYDFIQKDMMIARYPTSTAGSQQSSTQVTLEEC